MGLQLIVAVDPGDNTHMLWLEVDGWFLVQALICIIACIGGGLLILIDKNVPIEAYVSIVIGVVTAFYILDIHRIIDRININFLRSAALDPVPLEPPETQSDQAAGDEESQKPSA